MDKFAMHLAFHKGGEFLAKNSMLSFYTQVKKWLLGLFSSQKQVVNEKLLEKARTLEKYCVTKEKSGVVKKAPACTKGDLKLLMENFYSTATDALDYQDAALVCLMCHLFGRASDLSLVLKQCLSVSTSIILFLRLIRIKTSKEQGLSLFPERDGFATCSIHAIAVVLLMQDAPYAAFLSQLPTSNGGAEPSIAASIPLLELLGSGPDVKAGMGQDNAPIFATACAPGVHSYANRVLKTTTKVAGVESESLAFHFLFSSTLNSTRRGR